jgi:hypothetical protein
MSFMLLGILNAQAAGGGIPVLEKLGETTFASGSTITLSNLALTDYAFIQGVVESVYDGYSPNQSRSPLEARLNGDSGNNYSLNEGAYTPNTGLTIYNSSSRSTARIGVLGSDSTNNRRSYCEFFIMDPGATSKNKEFISVSGYSMANTDASNGFYSSEYRNTSAITSVSLVGNNKKDTRFTIYGARYV